MLDLPIKIMLKFLTLNHTRMRTQRYNFLLIRYTFGTIIKLY